MFFKLFVRLVGSYYAIPFRPDESCDRNRNDKITGGTICLRDISSILFRTNDVGGQPKRGIRIPDGKPTYITEIKLVFLVWQSLAEVMVTIEIICHIFVWEIIIFISAFPILFVICATIAFHKILSNQIVSGSQRIHFNVDQNIDIRIMSKVPTVPWCKNKWMNVVCVYISY